MTPILPSAPITPRYRQLERLALAVVAGLLMLSLFLRSMHWDWLVDTAFLIGAGLLAVASPQGQTKAPPSTAPSHTLGWRSLLGLYLFLDASVMALAWLPRPSLPLLFWLTLACLYGAALRLHLREAGLILESTPWRALLQPPFRLFTLGSLLPLLSMFMPMLHRFYGFSAWSGPTVITLPGTVHMNPGHTVNIGSTLIVRGCEITLGRPISVLLAGTAGANLFHLCGWVTLSHWLTFARAAAIAVALWWLAVARGFGSLTLPFNLLFLAGSLILLTAAFSSGRAPVAP